MPILLAAGENSHFSLAANNIQYIDHILNVTCCNYNGIVLNAITIGSYKSVSLLVILTRSNYLRVIS